MQPFAGRVHLNGTKAFGNSDEIIQLFVCTAADGRSGILGRQYQR